MKYRIKITPEGVFIPQYKDGWLGTWYVGLEYDTREEALRRIDYWKTYVHVKPKYEYIK